MSGRLVRDNIGNIDWKNEADKKLLRTVHSPEEHLNLLRRKLLEEAGEMIIPAVCDAPDGYNDALSEEMADVLEVLFAYAEVCHIPWDKVLFMNERKRAERGGFTRGIVWEV
jgi:predicted house-cleaning noncanonical NTP pyrophosphatase (MazG superfamily)